MSDPLSPETLAIRVQQLVDQWRSDASVAEKQDRNQRAWAIRQCADELLLALSCVPPTPQLQETKEDLSARVEQPVAIPSVRATASPGAEIRDQTSHVRMKMTDVRVGMRLRDTFNEFLPLMTVTAITNKGFRYVLDKPYSYGSRIGITTGGEHFGLDGQSCYELVGEPPSDPAVGQPSDNPILPCANGNSSLRSTSPVEAQAPPPPQQRRILTMARHAAMAFHCRWKEGTKRAIAQGHIGAFHACPHPDCVLVRALLSPETPQPAIPEQS